MKSRITLAVWIIGTACILGGTASFAAPMGTAFTYQGRFNASGNPAIGAYDFEFRLFDATTAGNQVGSTLTKDDLAVSDGYFTTTLDFGAGIFTGDARWLQIAVRPGAETGSYTTLTPRHELTPNPYAISSYHEGTANYIPKFTSTGLADSSLYESSGNIGIGTTSPSAKLHVSNGDVTFDGAHSRNVYITRSSGSTLHLAASILDTGGYVRTTTASPLRMGTNSVDRIVLGTTGDMNVNAGQLYVQQSVGRVGIGTTAPVERLDVNGTVRCVSVVETSDQQLKTDILPLAGVLDKLDRIDAVSFRWNEKAQSLGVKAGARQIGVLAQDLEQAFPELVFTPEPVTVDDLAKGYSEEFLTPEVRQQLQRDADATHYKAVNYSQLTVVLLKAVKELKAENDALRTQNSSLEERLARVEGLLSQSVAK